MKNVLLFYNFFLQLQLNRFSDEGRMRIDKSNEQKVSFDRNCWSNFFDEAQKQFSKPGIVAVSAR